MKSNDDMAELMETIFDKLRSVRADRQKAYAHDNHNALANFERAAEKMGVEKEMVWWIYAGKHWDGITAWVIGHRDQHEAVQGRIMDMMLYLILFWGMVDDIQAADVKIDEDYEESETARKVERALQVLLDEGYAVKRLK